MMTYIFGPVPSRRLGRSLGVDLIPLKTCTYDCVYCQVGKTSSRTVAPRIYAPVSKVNRELKHILETDTPDIITFSGSGEPTLHSEIHRVISFIRKISDLEIAVLTNGSLLWRDDVRARIGGADIIVPTLSSVMEKTFRTIHNPHETLDLNKIISGLKRLRTDFKGRIFLEVMLLFGLNDNEQELEGLKRTINQIRPDRIQLNTVKRPPADPRALSLDKKRLEEIRVFFGDRAEIIADIQHRGFDRELSSIKSAILEMARRRPVRTRDMATGLGIPLKDVEQAIKGLITNGSLRHQSHSGDSYYFASSQEQGDL